MELDLGPIIKKAMQAQMDHFKEEIRVLRASAWQEGYDAALEFNKVHVNPYSEEH